jgi:AraC-like DNA-binding protein
MAPSSDAFAPLVRFARLAQAPGLELVHHQNLRQPWQSVPETYTCFTLIVSLEGAVDVISRGVRAPGEAGSLTIGQPGEPWALRPRPAMRGEFRVVRVGNVQRDLILEDVGARRDPSLFPRGPQHDRALASRFVRLVGAIERGDHLDVDQRLVAFLSAIARRAGSMPALSPTRSRKAVRRAQELLHARFDTTLSLAELAAAAETDRFALLRAFSRELGMTPHAYQMQLRMARACRLIASGLPLADVALDVGYSEQSALSRPFKRLVGVTPGAYARARR